MPVSRRTALAQIAAGAALSGCAKAPRDDVLRVAYSPPTLSPLYRSLASEFTRRHPGASIELLPAVDYKGVMQRDFRLALVGNEPDVSHVGLNHVHFYAARELATPLDAYIERETEPLTTHDAIGRVNGQRRALPFAVSIPVTYFNVDLCKRVGIRADTLPQLDWDGIIDLARAIRGLGGDVSGQFFDYTPESALAWQMLVYAHGGRMLQPDERTVAFGDRAGLRSAQLLQAIGRTGQVDMSRENARMAFAAGLVGCYQNTSANIGRFTRARSQFELAVAPLPTLPDVGRLPAAGNAVVLTTRRPERRELAWQYIRFATGPIGQTLMARSTGYLSLNRRAVEAPGLLRSLVEENPTYRLLYRNLSLLNDWYAFPGPHSEQIAESINERMRRLLLGRETPEIALSEMVSDAQRLLDRG